MSDSPRRRNRSEDRYTAKRGPKMKSVTQDRHHGAVGTPDGVWPLMVRLLPFILMVVVAFLTIEIQQFAYKVLLFSMQILLGLLAVMVWFWKPPRRHR
jgi:glucan phosphoethanolaminetransferase (alkaline phosphatase superfamily)